MYLIFADKKANSRDIARHINLHFSKQIQALGIARHYHGGISTDYLEQTYSSFASKDGKCRIMIAMKGASTVCSLLS
jgi:hypothetical protein